MPRTLLTLALATALAAPAAQAADDLQLTVYRSDSAALYSAGDGSVGEGYAVVHERRTLRFANGTQDMLIGNLPAYLDPEAVALGLPADSRLQVLSQRLLLAQGQGSTLSGHVGKQVTVLGGNGQTLVQGTLAQANADGSLVIGGDEFGPTVVRDYAAVKLTGGEIGSGSRLQLRVTGSGSGSVQANLSYPTAGIGWRAAYTATLKGGDSCSMQFKSNASIANRSGRDWNDAQLMLVAGMPQFAKPSAQRPQMMAMAATGKAYAEADTPQQDALEDYRSYTLAGAVDLPNASVTLTPLYKTRTLDCERSWTFENGGAWTPSQPALAESWGGNSNSAVASALRFKAFDSLPAGFVQVTTVDAGGHAQFLGQSRIDDTANGRRVDVTLGTAFDLNGERERVAFQVDKAARTMDESFRISLHNAGGQARTITVVEHPNRWRNWELVSSSSEPSRRTTDTLEFRVPVPANGKAILDYAVRYSWTQADE